MQMIGTPAAFSPFHNQTDNGPVSSPARTTSNGSSSLAIASGQVATLGLSNTIVCPGFAVGLAFCSLRWTMFALQRARHAVAYRLVLRRGERERGRAFAFEQRFEVHRHKRLVFDNQDMAHGRASPTRSDFNAPSLS